MISRANIVYIKGVEGAEKNSKPKYGKWNSGWIYCMSIQPRRMNLSVLIRMSIPSPIRKYARVKAEAGIWRKCLILFMILENQSPSPLA